MRPFFAPAAHSPHWNVSILTLMAASVSLAYALATLAEGTPSPRLRLLLQLGALLAATGSALLFYARFIEPHWIIVTHQSVPFPIDRTLRVAIIGDFHVGPFKRAPFMARVVRTVNALHPDIILLAGDFLFDHEAEVEHLEPLQHLTAPLGVFGVVGNHDSSANHLPSAGMRIVRDRCDELVGYLEPRGIQFLRNRSVTVEHAGTSIAIAGTDDLWMDSFDLRRTLRGTPPDMPTILLSHNPDIILDPASHRAHIIVAGHTHGGQVRLPWIGALAALPQRLSKKFDQGVCPLSPSSTVVITRGIGETILPLRFFARPEVMMIEARTSQ